MVSIRKNIISIFTGWLIPVVVFFLLIPYLVNNIGEEAFGIFSLITVVSGYVSFLNFGFGQAITKHVATYHAQNLHTELNKTLFVSLLFFLLIGFIGCLFIYLLSEYAVNQVFNISLVLRESAIISFKVASLGFLLNMLIECLRGLSIGLNNFFIPNLCKSIRIILSSLLMVYAVFQYGSLHAIVIGNIIGQFIAFLINIFLTLRLFRPLSISFDLDIFKKMIRYSKYVFGAKVLNFISSETGIIILGIVGSAIEITYFVIPKRLISRMLEVFSRYFEMLFPISSYLKEKNQNEKLINIYIDLVKFQILITIPIIIIIIFQGNWMLSYWINNDFADKSFIILIILCLNGLISLSTNLPGYYAMGLGYPEYTTRFSFYRFLIIVICIYPLTKFYGSLGVALTLLISQIQAIYFIFYTPKNILKINIFSKVKLDIFKYTFISICFFIIYKYLGSHINNIEGILYQLSISILLIGLYLLLVLSLKIFTFESLMVKLRNAKQ